MSHLKMSLSTVNGFLDSYNNRDKVLRLLYYGFKTISGLCSQNTYLKIKRFNEHIDSCRTFLRLFDDLPMLDYTLKYGLGEEEPDILMQVCGVMTNIFDQFYYPLEHLAWAIDNRFLSGDSSKWWYASTICWIGSLYLSLCKSLRYFSVLQSTKKCQNISNCHDRKVFEHLSNMQFSEIINMARCLSDLVQAIHWLPPGLLWSGQLKDWHIGVLGTISSVLSICMTTRITCTKDNNTL